MWFSFASFLIPIGGSAECDRLTCDMVMLQGSRLVEESMLSGEVHSSSSVL